MKTVTFPLLFAALILSCLNAGEFHQKFKHSHWPAAITFMVVDYKYNSEQGVKICEVQHGSTSAFTLGRYARDGDCVTTRKFIETFSQWTSGCWIKKSSVCDKTLFNALKSSPQWSVIKNFKALFTDKNFLQSSIQPVYDPGDINHYHAICYETRRAVASLIDKKNLYPGILIIDEPTYPYWTNKLKMGLVFTGDPILEKVKPVWNAYDKTNAKEVYQQILTDIPGEYVVIKPIGSFRSKGVIAIHKTELQELIELIIDYPSELKKHPNENWRSWSSDRSSSFLVEQFIESDPMPAEDGKCYDVTYRTTFLLSYEQEEITLRLFDTYLKYPQKSLDREGTFTEKHCSHPNIMLVGHIPSELEAELEQQLSRPLLLMFEKMLSADKT